MVKQETKSVQYSPKLPEYKDLLKAGVHFGHPTNKWNPAAKLFIYTQRNGIHIIDINKTLESLKEILPIIANHSSKGGVLFVGTKNQAKGLVEKTAIANGAYFVTHRWVGGILTNFKLVKKSLEKLRKLESDFETGIEGRTKQEISWMKKEWSRLNRLYGGVKTMNELPTMVVIVDPSFEKSAVQEAKALNIPTVGLVDTNTDPSLVTYPIYGNDDALSALELMINVLGEAIGYGNKGHAVKHELKDYSKVEVKKIVRIDENQLVKPKKIRVRVANVKKETPKVEVQKEAKQEVKKAKKTTAKTTKKAVKKTSKKVVSKK